MLIIGNGVVVKSDDIVMIMHNNEIIVNDTIIYENEYADNVKKAYEQILMAMKYENKVVTLPVT